MPKEITILGEKVYFQGYFVAELKQDVPATVLDRLKRRLGYEGEIPQKTSR